VARLRRKRVGEQLTFGGRGFSSLIQWPHYEQSSSKGSKQNKFNSAGSPACALAIVAEAMEIEMSTQNDELELAIETERVAALKETEEWKNDFAQRFDINDPRNQNLWDWLVIARLGRGASFEQRQRLLSTVIKAGGVVTLPHLKDEKGNTILEAGQFEFMELPVEEPAPVAAVEETPAHRGQELWKQHAAFMRTGGKDGGEPTMEEVRSRKATNASFRAFIENALRTEMTEGGVGDEVQNLNARPEEPKKPSRELQAWAQEYHRTSAEKLRQLKRADTNPFGYLEWNKNFEAAIAAGLV
jgi:hypothetical protein